MAGPAAGAEPAAASPGPACAPTSPPASSRGAPRAPARARRILPATAALVLAPWALALAPPPAPPAPGAQAGSLQAELTAEVPLDNDTFLTTREEAVEALEEGDALLAGLDDPDAAQLAPALEAWRRALAESDPGDLAPAASALPLPDVDGTAERAAVGVWVAVERRLRWLGPEGTRAWRERFDELAAVELAAAGLDADALAAVERRNPRTPAAARAALARAELALERGRAAAAATWLDRAERHARDGDLGAPFLPEAFAARRAVVAALGSAPAPAETTDWRAVAGLELVNIFLIDDPGVEGRADLPSADRGVRPGAVDLGDGRAALQTASRVHLLDLETGAIEGAFEPAKLAADLGPDEVVMPRGAPGWPLLPLWDGEALVLVQGTADAERGNALIAVVPPEPGELLPRLRWAVREHRVFDADGAPRRHPLLDALGDYEIQPGPVIVGETVVVQVWQRLRREAGVFGDSRFATGGEVRAWLVGLDRRTGEPQWTTWLAKGVERGRAGGGVLMTADRISNGQPLGVAGDRAVVVTQLGVVASVAAVDGRVDWALRTRRRDAEERSWGAARPVLSGELLHVAPGDSDRLYWLRPGPDLDGRGLLAHPPAAVPRPRALLDALGPRSVVLQRAGVRPALALVEPRLGSVQQALHLAPEEVLAGAAATAGGALVVSTDRGVYVFDRERELYLCRSAGLLPSTVATGPRRPRGGEAGLGGTVHLFGNRILITGPHQPAAEGRPSSLGWVFGPSPR